MFNGELIITISVISLLIYGLVNKSTQGIKWLIILAYMLAIFLILTNSINSLTDMLMTNQYISIIKVILILSSIPFLSNTLKYEYNILLSSSLTGMLLLISSTNLLAIYLALELQSLSGYLLTAFDKKSKNSTEAGLKYFILGALASGLILFGITLIYGFTGLVNLKEIQLLDNLTTGSILGALFVIIGFLFKLGAVPFHGWIPDVYEGSMTKVMAFFATVPKISLLIILINLLNIAFYNAIEIWQPLIIMSSILSIVIGSLGALYQTKIKRFFAYSTIANVGFILMGLASGTIEGIEASIVYTIIYMITNLGLLLMVLGLCPNGDSPELKEIQEIGITKGVAFTILLFSTAGLPPLAGFIGKLGVFISAINEEMYLLVTIAILMSVISTAYYIRLIKIIFFESKIIVPDQRDGTESEMTINLSNIYIGISLIIISTLILNPSKLLEIGHNVTINLIN